MSLFTEHPASVNETYLEHMGQASSFGSEMILCGIACLFHGLFPFLFEKTGSNAIRRLNERMVLNRVRNIRSTPVDPTLGHYEI
jgi:hypothetical protein